MGTTDDATADDAIDAQTYDPDDVPFVPRRLVGPPLFPRSRHDLTTATATSLIRWLGACPECGAGLDPDPTNGRAVDRDVVFDPETPGAAPVVCPECGADLRVFVEEAAQPRRVSDRSAQYAGRGVLWVRLDDDAPPDSLDEQYMQVYPDIRVSTVVRSDD